MAAQAMQWSNAELARVHAAAYQGRTARLCLASNTGGLTKASTTSQWDALEITSQAASGYARVVWTIPAGAYDAGSGTFKTVEQLCTFQATGGGLGLTWDSVYLVLGTTTGGATTWDTAIAGLYMESPNIALAPGTPRGYRVSTMIDDITALA